MDQGGLLTLGSIITFGSATSLFVPRRSANAQAADFEHTSSLVVTSRKRLPLPTGCESSAWRGSASGRRRHWHHHHPRVSKRLRLG